MKKLLLIGSLAFGIAITSSVAQDGAAQVFERAKVAHGGAAVEAIKTYSDTGTLNFYQNGQLAAKFAYSQKYDFTSFTARIEVSLEGQPVVIQQVSKSVAWQWSPQSGVVSLPDAQAKPIRDSFYQGFFALRAKTADLTDLKSDGLVKLSDTVSGPGISFKLNGVTTSLVTGNDGVILGGKAVVNGATIVTVQGDNRVVGGIKLPFSVQSSSDGQPVTELQTSAAQINSVFTDADFAQPK
jgi:hypothetical protein